MLLKSRLDGAEKYSVLKLLCVCPSLFITDTVLKALVLSVVFTAALLLSETLVSLLRNLLDARTKYAVCLIVTAFSASLAEILTKIFVPSAVTALGVYLPILAVSCVIVLKTEEASSMTPGGAIADSIVTGARFLGIMALISFVRELFGNGTLGQGLGNSGGIRVFISAPLPILSQPAGVLMLAALGIATAKIVNEKISDTKEEGTR